MTAAARKILALAKVVVVFCVAGAPVHGQIIDGSWMFSVNGQTAQANPDGSFRIPNIAAPDRWGSGGPGTRPDFLSDDFLRVVGVGTVGGRTLYAFSEPFRITNRQTFLLGELTVTETPPPFPETIRVLAPVTVLTPGQSVALQVLGTLLDGSQLDVTPEASFTTYRTSNPQIAMVDPDGLVTAQNPGAVFITAMNEGATAVRGLTVVTSTNTTTVEGFVQLEDGTPVPGATVTLVEFGLTTVSQAPDGFFTFIDVVLPADQGNLSFGAAATVGGQSFSASTTGIMPMFDGLTDAGILTLIPVTAITINFDAGIGSPRTYTESGMTVTSLQTHLHFGDSGGDPSVDLLNHSGCCSTPYQFDLGGPSFSVVALDVVADSSSGTIFTSSLGAVEMVSGNGPHAFPAVGWQGITSFQWNVPSGQMAIDNLVIEIE